MGFFKGLGIFLLLVVIIGIPLAAMILAVLRLCGVVGTAWWIVGLLFFCPGLLLFVPWQRLFGEDTKSP